MKSAVSDAGASAEELRIFCVESARLARGSARGPWRKASAAQRRRGAGAGPAEDWGARHGL